MASFLINDPKRAVREKSLSSIVESLTNNGAASNPLLENFLTLLTQCLQVVSNSQKKGSKKASKLEIHLSLRAIALLAISLNESSNSHEVFEESFPVLTRALGLFESDPETIIMVLECLALVAFFGCGEYYDETQSVMLVIWDYVIGEKTNTLVRSKAISGWCFLLSGMQGCYVSSKYWKNVIPELFDILGNLDKEVENDAAMVVRATVVDTFGVIFESGVLHKFMIEEEGEKEERDEMVIKERIVGKLRELVINGKTREKHWKSLEIFDKDKNGNCSRINNQMAEIVQGKVLRGLLGEKGFERHVRDNCNLFRPRRRSCMELESDDDSHEELFFAAKRKEVKVSFYRGGGERPNLALEYGGEHAREKHFLKRKTKSPYSSMNKARSMLLKKQREVMTHYRFGDELDYEAN